ncbi:MAG: ABC transporter permease [Candidatus Dormibacteria bacterium]
MSARAVDGLGPALGRLRPVLVGISALVAVFLVLPLIAILPSSLTAGQFLVFPPQGISPRWYASVAADSAWQGALVRSVELSLAGATIALTGGTLAALGISRLRRGGRIVRATLLIPLVAPGIVYALGLYSLLARVGLDRSELGVIAGQATLALPVVVIVVSAALAAIDPAVPLAARSLGARARQVIWRVELPLVRRGLLAAFVMAFTLCFDEVVVALFLSPPSADTVPTHLFSQSQDNLAPDLAAVGILVVASALVLLGAASVLLRPARRRGVA